MTYKQALEIIDVEQHGQHDYTLRCKFCGKSKKYETDALVSQLTDMAKKHQKCREKEEVAEDEEPYFKDDEDKCPPIGMEGGVVTTKRRIG